MLQRGESREGAALFCKEIRGERSSVANVNRFFEKVLKTGISSSNNNSSIVVVVVVVVALQTLSSGSEVVPPQGKIS